MAIEPEPQLKKPGKYLLALVGAVVLVVVCGVMLQACQRRTVYVAERQWGQGYDTPQGQYMQPDHGWFYYWMASNLLFRNPQPTYHIYYPPAGYPPTYRPWQSREYYRNDSGQFVRRPVIPSADPRRDGGFVLRPNTDPRRDGGFAKPPAKTVDPRSSGGFSKPITPPANPRSSGGFSKPAAPSSNPRSSGGFAKPSSNPRSSGGFSKKK